MNHLFKLLSLFVIFFGAYGDIADKRFGVIINGTKAKITSHPYYAFIGYKSRTLKCGGAIIKTNVILTAAHCLSSDNFYVYTGIEKNYDLIKSAPYQVKEIIIHPQYKGHTAYDIGLVILQKHIKLNSKVKVINVASINPKIHSRVKVVGFGKTVCKPGHWLNKNAVCVGSNSDVLRSTTLRIIKYKNQVMYTKGQSSNTCYGDSGGPVVFQNKVVGLVSSGEYSNCTGYDTQVAVASHYFWIKKYLS